MINKKVISFTALFLFLGLNLNLSAQSIDNVQFPPSIEWKKIDTSHFTLIFPEVLEDKAKDIAEMLESYYPADEYSLNTDTLRWPVILNNSFVYPNAYVQGAPRHSQLYTIPSQEGFQGAANWLENIWSHELRHIVQNDKMLRGFTAFAHWIAGEYGSSAMPHFALPSWLWEGDAVLTETLLSSGGRGREAGFERVMRTDLLNGVRNNYYKASLGYYGSYRETLPSWYVMGYHLCTYIRKEYGIETFNTILETSADFSFTPLIFNIAVKKATGKGIKAIYSDCLDELETKWREQLGKRQITDVEIIRQAEVSKNSNYYPLGVFNDGSIAALKTSAADINSLVKIGTDGEEERLRKIAPFDKNISFNGSTFCWNENITDIRWGNLSWSVIRLYNPLTGDYRIITDKTRYLSPSISPDGKLVAAVEITPELDSFIVVLDSENGELLERFAEPAGASPSQTCWTEDSSGIVYVRQYDWMESIRLLSLSEHKNIALTEPSTKNISSPVVINGAVYFVSEETGIESIHRTEITAGGNSVIVSRPYGTAFPAAGINGLLFADYGPEGYSIASVDPGKAEAIEINAAGSEHVDYFEGLQQQELWAGMAGPGKTGALDTEKVLHDYDIKDYPLAMGLLNFHSRSIVTTISGTGLAVSLQADDILNNSSGNIYLGWDPYLQGIVTGTGGVWAGTYTAFLYGADLLVPIADTNTSTAPGIYGGIWLPFNFSRGIIDHSLSIQEIVRLGLDVYTGENNLVSQSRLNWRLTEKMAKRDIYPPLGISLSAGWYNTLLTSFYNQIVTEADIYIPGLFSNHGIKINLNADVNHPSSEANLPPDRSPRGDKTNYLGLPFVLGGSIDYSLPLIYPDLAIGGLMYISRFYLNGFLDAALLWNSVPANLSTPATQFVSTAGMEIFMDFHLFNNSFPLRTGLRFIYNLQNGRMRIEDTTLLLGFDIL